MSTPNDSDFGLCATCGTGYYLPSGVCDHCDTAQPGSKMARLRELESENARLREDILTCIDAREASISFREATEKQLDAARAQVARLRAALEKVADPQPMLSPTECASKRRRLAETALADGAGGGGKTEAHA